MISADLNRQVLGREEVIGQPRAPHFAAYLQSMNRHVAVEAIDHEPDDAEALELARRVDVILACPPTFEERLRLNDAAVGRGRRLIDAAQWGMTGTLVVVDPRRTACLRCVYPQEPEFEEFFPVVGAISWRWGRWRPGGDQDPFANRKPDVRAAVHVRWISGQPTHKWRCNAIRTARAAATSRRSDRSPRQRTDRARRLMNVHVLICGRGYDAAEAMPSQLTLPEGATTATALETLRACLSPGQKLSDACLVAVSGTHLGTLATIRSRNCMTATNFWCSPRSPEGEGCQESPIPAAARSKPTTPPPMTSQTEITR